MADAQLRAVITAEDRATKVIEQVGSKIATLDDRFSVIRQNLDKIGQGMTSVGTKMSAALTAPIIGIGVYGVKAFSDLNEAVNAANVTFGKASNRLLEFGQTAAQSAGLSQRAFLQASVPIGAALQNVGLNANQAADWTIKLTQRAADMASVFNTDVNSALLAIQAGLRGEIDPLERFGVGLNEASVKAYALANGIIESDRELTLQEKTVARLGLVMEQTNRVQDDFKNTSDGLANSTRIARAELENNAAALGEKLAPIANKVVLVLSELIDRFSRLSPAAQNTIIILAGLTAVIGPLLLVTGTLITTLTAVSGALGAVGLSLTAVLGPIALVVAALAGLTYAYFQIKEKYGSLGEFFRQTWDGIVIIFREAWEGIKRFALDPLENKINTIKNAITSVASAARNLPLIGGAIGIGASIGNLFGRASGGSVAPNRPFIVGENGPEVFTPNTYGMISRGAGAGGITINFNNTTFMGREGIAEQIGNEIMKMLKRNARL